MPVIAICFWIWINPRVFGKPSSTDNWASKAVLGERVLLSPPKSGIPAHHKKAIYALKILMFAGFIPAIIGLIILNPFMAVSGLIITILGKTWFLDRMVWLYQNLIDEKSEYKSWLY